VSADINLAIHTPVRLHKALLGEVISLRRGSQSLADKEAYMTKPSLAATAATILISLQLLAFPQSGFTLSCVPAPSGLVSWWPGDGNAVDLASGNNGVLSNGATFVAGEVGQTFSFTTNHAGVVVGNATNLQMQSFTIETWIQRASASVITLDPGYNGMVFSYGYFGYGLYIGIADNALSLSKIGYDHTSGAGAPAIADTNWHHVAVTKSGTTVVFYIDGAAFPAPAYSSTFQFTTPAAIGARPDYINTNGNCSFYGAIDELAVYNRALTATEIQSIVNAGAAGKCKPTGLFASPSTGLSSTGYAGGPFSPSNQVYTLINDGTNTLNWSAGSDVGWIDFSITSGTLAGGTATNVTATINSLANSFAIGVHSNTVTFTNLTDGNGTTNLAGNLTIVCVPPAANVSGGGSICAGALATIQATLTGTAPWSVTWSDGFVQSGITTSPVTRTVSPPTNTTYTITSISDADCTGGSSGTAAITVQYPPSISVQPSNATVCVGSPVTFSVTAGASAGGSSVNDTSAVTGNGNGSSSGPIALKSDSATFRSDRILVKPRKGHQVSELAAYHTALGTQVHRTFPRFGNLQILRLPVGVTVQQAIAHYQKSGLVEYAEPDYEVHAILTPNDPQYLDGSLWSLNNYGQNGGTPHADISAPAAWDTRTSANPIIVAVIDTGVWYTHPDLASNMWVNPCVGCPVNGVVYPNDVYGINAITGSGDPLDDFFHGTHCAGIIGAIGNNSVGVVGVTWNVRIMACKFLDSSGSGNTSDAITCIDYAVSKGAKLLSNSWGGGGYSQALYDAIAAARDADVIFVAAAGNNGSNNDTAPSYPASYALSNIVAVAATDHNDLLASFSNYGANSVTLGAPGVSIFNTLPNVLTPAMQQDGLPVDYGTLSGTSMACPHVSGALALVRAQFPDLTYSGAIAELRATVDPIPSLTGKTATGGRLNLQKLLTHHSPLAYQWYKSGASIPGATNISYTIASVDYADAGSYQVVITNGCGQAVSSNAPLTVINCYVVPTANFSAAPTNGGAPLTVTFSDTSTGTVTNRFWSFGDGATTNVTATNFSHAYAGQGSYTVSLTASGPLGSDTLTKNNLVTVGPSLPCAAPPSGLVSWWAGDGNAVDVGSGNNGVLSNGVTFAAGEVGQTFSFGTNHAGVVVGNPTNLQLQNLTIEAWIKRASATVLSLDPGYNGMLFSYGSFGYGLYIGLSNNLVSLSKIGLDHTTGTGSPQIADTNWHHVAVTKSNTTVVFYIDGAAYPAPTYSSTFQFTTPAAIGVRPDLINTSDNNSFFGAIDELSIYNRVLTPAEIQSIFAQGANGKCKGAGLVVSPATELSSSGLAGGPFNPSSQGYTLSNATVSALNWVANKSAAWLDLSVTGGTLPAGALTSMVVSINANANTLPGGAYSDTILFTNMTSGTGSANRSVSLTVINRGTFFDDVENGTNGWTASSLWHIVGAGGCSNSFSPTHSWYYGSDATCTYNTGGANSGDLISPLFVVPISGNLTFQSWEQTEGTTANWDKRLVYISTNGTASWIQLLQSVNNASAWYQRSIDLSPYAGNMAQLRFRFDTVDGGANTYRGWYIDDVHVMAAPTLTVTPVASLNASGEQGGPFTPPAQLYTLSNPGDRTLNWSASVGDIWLSLSAASGSLGAGATTNVTVGINAAANALVGGLYSDVVGFVNSVNGKGNTNLPATLLVRDGISDAWRYTYWHHVDPRADDQSRAQDDPDGDGVDNLHEFLAGTDPTDSGSYFRITSVLNFGADVSVTWMMGAGKTNALQATGGGSDGSYATNGFIDLFTVSNTVGSVTNYLDAGAATGPAKYYRVRIVP
jgi:subtilisin family serine protease